MGQSTRRKRGRAGERDRARRLAKYPLCAHCLKEGIVKATDEIDHIVELEDGGPDTDDNCQGLCFEHHRKKSHKSMQARLGIHGYTEEGKPLNPDHPWAQ